MPEQKIPRLDEERIQQLAQMPDRQAQPVDAEEPPRLPYPIVGIGASAGGLEAIGAFFDACRSDAGIAYVVVQHLPPERESMMAEILGRHTRMPVHQVEDGMAVQSDHVYVIRPGHVLKIRDGHLHLGPRLGGPRAANRPIDDFFKSLAEEQRERAIGIIMSGMGSNGTAGAQAIKAVGGLCVAQDPDSAQFPSMPRHLIAAGYADQIVRPAEMPGVVLGYANHSYARGGREADAATTVKREGDTLREVLAILRTRTRHDFSGYKKPTLLRRVQRRMGLNRTDNMSEFAKLLRQTPAEATALADDLLIHVTGFFRDPEAWEALRKQVIAPLVAARESGSPLRAWVTACSSGEEAYTLAILLTEAAEQAHKHFDIKVFATDLAERALGYARAGIYPGGIESEITPERLERFFTQEDELYRVRPELRDRVVFASQNVLQDPPFSRLDIATCRNLLIYLEPDIQNRVLALLHFGLREGGALFLGTSETVAGTDELFETIDKKARIYRRIGPTRHGRIEFPTPHALNAEGNKGMSGSGLHRLPRRGDGPKPLIENISLQALLEEHTPPAVTVDRDHRILYYHGDTRPFLEQLSGEPTRDLMLLARDGIRGAIRIALHRAAAQNARAIAEDGWVDQNSERRIQVAVTVSPIIPEDRDGPADWFVVSFSERGELPAPDSVDDPDDVTRRLREELRSTIEELQTSNEELKASNEEVMSINEEMQSANEELETSKEEMQSLNEELSTVNSQLRTKMEELESSTSDLASLLASTDLAVLFLDTSFRIRRYTPAARVLVDMIAGDVGRPLSALALKFDDPHLDEDCRAVLDRLMPSEREVLAEGGRYFLRRVTAYRTVDNRIDGIVLTFVDITSRRKTEAALRESEERLRLALESATDFAILTVDPNLIVTSWNPGAAAIFGYPAEEIVGTSFAHLFTPEDRAADIPKAETMNAMQHGRAADERWHLRKDGSQFFASGVLTLLGDGDRGFVKVLRDLTERKKAEDELRNSRDELERRVDERTAVLQTTLETLKKEMKRRRDLARQLATAQEDERRRVSRELHDSVGQLLASLSLAVRAVGTHGNKLSPAVADQLAEVQKVSDELGRQVHELAVRLRPTVLDDVGLQAALSQLISEWSSRTGLPVAFPSNGLELRRLPAEAETVLYRVVQEALTNVAKHASATRASVVLGQFGGLATVVVEDDGVGFNPDSTVAGRLGLLGMRERLALLGGELDIESSANGGTTVIARIPISDLPENQP